MSKLKTAIIGPTGYTGLELIRILSRHPGAEVSVLLSRRPGRPVISDIFPSLVGVCELKCELIDDEKCLEGVDVAFVALPHTVAMAYVPRLLERGLRVVDMSADYRLPDPAVYEKWYGMEHADKARLDEAVYGLPEFMRERIREAKLVANPGCYPTAALLALAPLAEADMLDPGMPVIVDAKSGATGAGRTPTLVNYFPERNENVEPYGVGDHRHMPEMEQVLTDVTGKETTVLFQPHLVPMDRGMLCTIYAAPTGGVTREQLTDVLEKAYADAPFVRVRTDVLPATKYVSGTNFCDLAAHVAKGKVILFSALDNMIKGASGQAIQNMNIMFGFDETAGLY